MTDYFDRLSFMADDIVKQKRKIKKDFTVKNFKESVTLVQNFTNELFNGNNPKLISLLYFDAYKLFYKSHADIEAVPPYGDSYPEFVDLAVLDEVDSLSVNGWITKKHYDRDAAAGHSYNEQEYTYYGCLSISYIDEYMRNISKTSSFEQNLLRTRVYIDENVYDLLVMAIDGELKYSLYSRKNKEESLLLATTSSSLKDDVENYIANGGCPEIRTLFPEVYKEAYFRDYKSFTRVR